VDVVPFEPDVVDPAGAAGATGLFGFVVLPPSGVLKSDFTCTPLHHSSPSMSWNGPLSRTAIFTSLPVAHANTSPVLNAGSLSRVLEFALY
jgi:hypothetical protein